MTHIGSQRARVASPVFTLALAALLVAFSAVAVDARPKVALVLGGGSARGLSHVGLLKALEEAGIPIDYIVGASMGSVVAGLYAAGLSADNLMYMLSNIDTSELFVPTIPPRGGFLSTQRFKVFLDVLTDHARMESLPIPFHTVAINLLTGEEETLSTGPLSTGIIASMSIPGMFPPVRIGDNYYVDGGMRSLVPVDVAKELGADLIIAVDVRRKLANINHETVLSNVQLTLLFVLGWDTPRQLEAADVVIRPPVTYDSYMAYEEGDYFVRAGYEGAQTAIPQVREALLALDPDFPFRDGTPMFGYPEDVFAERFWRAVAAAARISPGAAVSPHVGLSYDGAFGLQFGVAVPFAVSSGGPAWYAAYAGKMREGDAVHTLRLGYVSCSVLCVSALARTGPADAPRGLGLGVEGSLRNAWRYSAEWEGTGPAAGSWRIVLTAPARVGLTEPQGELDVRVFRDLRGLYGAPAGGVQTDVRYRYFIPWRSGDYWDAVRTATSWFVGAGARSLAGPSLGVQPLAEAGIVLEARLFGLYPLRSRLWFEYQGGQNAWAFYWTLGNL